MLQPKQESPPKQEQPNTEESNPSQPARKSKTRTLKIEESPKPEEAKKKHTRTSRGRSKRGCFECRERHLKCDETLPTCNRCANNGRICSRPSINRSSAVTSISSITTSVSPVTSQSGPSPTSTTTVVSRISIFPRSPSSPTNDPNGVFKWIGSPQLQNMDSLVFWLRLQTPDAPEGFAGNLTPSWVTLIQEHRDDDPAVLSMFSMHALMVQGQATGICSKRYCDRAMQYTIEQAKLYKHVSSALLMIVLYMGSGAGHEGDLDAAEMHFSALKTLYHKEIQMTELEWVFLWGTDITLATMLRRQPLLPWHIPPAFRDPIPLSADEMSKLHRLAANNSASMLALAGGDFLSISEILRDLHLIYRSRHSKVLDETNPSIHAHTISLSWKTNSLHLQAKAKADKTQLPADLCTQLLALALQSSTWHFTMPYVSQDDMFLGEPESFPSIPSVLRSCTGEILEKIGGSNRAIDAWSASASLESFVWISYTMALNFRTDKIEVTSPWISTLYLAASLAGVVSGDDLRALLTRWPCDVKQVDTIVDGFVQHILLPNLSGLVMPIR